MGGVASLALHLRHLGFESKAHAEAWLTWYNWIEGSAASMIFSDGFRRDAQSIRADWQGRASAEKDSLPPNPETVLRAVYDNKVMELTDRIHQLEAQAATHQDKTNASYVNIPVAEPGNPTASLLERRLYKAAPASSPEAAASPLPGRLTDTDVVPTPLLLELRDTLNNVGPEHVPHFLVPEGSRILDGMENISVSQLTGLWAAALGRELDPGLGLIDDPKQRAVLAALLAAFLDVEVLRRATIMHLVASRKDEERAKDL